MSRLFKYVPLYLLSALLSLQSLYAAEPIASVKPLTFSGAAEQGGLQLVPSVIRPLPGSLDTVPMLNSNSPEVVQSEGVLVSTMNQDGSAGAGAGVQDSRAPFQFNGRFDIFAHHIARAANDGDQTTLYLGVLLRNPGNKVNKIEVLSGATALSQPDAPFIPLPACADNAVGDVYAGPGDRVANEVLRGMMQKEAFPAVLQLNPGETRVFAALPIPVRTLQPPLNGRSLLVRLKSSAPVEAATVALFARKKENGQERAPLSAEWLEALTGGRLAGPREAAPTPLNAGSGIIYGRVAGVQEGSTWTAILSDDGDQKELSIPPVGETISFPISTVAAGTMGTGQVQSARLLARMPDTALQAHGNYGVKYDITIPLVNRQSADVLTLIRLQSPLKTDAKSGFLKFYKSPSRRVFFRGTVKVTFVDAQKCKREKYVHLVQHQGEQATALAGQYLKPGESRSVRLEFIYPPDATPPQVVTVESVEPGLAFE